jgi:hypothetical protein
VTDDGYLNLTLHEFMKEDDYLNITLFEYMTEDGYLNITLLASSVTYSSKFVFK